MEKGEIGKRVDVRQACCYASLTKLILNATSKAKPDEIVEVIATSELRDDFDRFVQQERYEVLGEIQKGDELRFRIKRQ